MRGTAIWLASLLGTSLSVVIAYFWLDRPIALWVHDHLQLGFHGTVTGISHWPDPLIPLAILALIVLGLRVATSRSPLGGRQAAALVASVSVLITEVFKDLLKFIFSRPWPESWMGNNPSFIRDGIYGFHFLHGGSYQSFPSGHMAASCAVLAVLWIWYPRWRALYLIAALTVGLGLIAANYHFLSDVLAGAFLGTSVAWFTSLVWRAAARAMDLPDKNSAGPFR